MEITNSEKNGDVVNAVPHVEAVSEQAIALLPLQQTQKRGRGKRLRTKDAGKEEEIIAMTNGDRMPGVKNHTDVPVVQEENGVRLETDHMNSNNAKKETENVDEMQHAAYLNGNATINGADTNKLHVEVDAENTDENSGLPIPPTMLSPPCNANQQSDQVSGESERVRHLSHPPQAPGKRGKKAAPPPSVGSVFQTHEHQGPQVDSLPTPPSAAPKRVLPTRQRRGGPGVGTCHVDLLIIETEKRAKESRPVVPPTQKFFLSTNAHLVPLLPEPEGGESSSVASTSYFEKPEVKAAYLAQKAIQVPEFWPLPNDAVGGRLRARQDEEGYETSDIAYVNRHRKYESFEKRQRRREKEKLVHEQYKLKERIDQLRGMDTSAFGPGGEARRKEMLDIAVGLESRYAILLPPEPKKVIYKKGDKRRGRSVGPRAGTTTGGEEGESEEECVQEERAISQSVYPPEKARQERGKKKEEQEDRHEPEAEIKSRRPTPAETRTQAVTVALQATVVPNEMRRLPAVVSAPVARRGRSATAAAASVPPVFTLPHPVTPVASVVPTTVASTSATSRSAIYETPSEGSPDPIDAFSGPPRKRQRIESLPPSTTPEPMFTQSVLLQIAARKAAQPTARQTGRSLTAFGFRVPPEVEEILPTYMLPEWLITQDELEQYHAERQQQRLSQQQKSGDGV